MERGDIPDDWKPTPPPEVGSERWKDDIAFQMAMSVHALSCDENTLLDCGTFNGHDIGLLAVRRSPSGWDYFRIDRNNLLTRK